MSNTNEILHIVERSKNESIDTIMRNVQNFDKTELLNLLHVILEADRTKDINFFKTLEGFNNIELNSAYAQSTSTYLRDVDYYIDLVNVKKRPQTEEHISENALPGNLIK